MPAPNWLGRKRPPELGLDAEGLTETAFHLKATITKDSARDPAHRK
jgi:hypothetical protein